MTMRGHTNLGGGAAVISPFMDNGDYQRISISIDNSYYRGYIPPFSLWAPSNYGTYPYLYMPYIPAINVTTANSTTSVDIDNMWYDYFRVGDEIFILDVSALASDNLAWRGLAGTDESAEVLGTNTLTISAKGAKDSGGTGYTLITTDTQHTGACTGGAIGTGDILVLAGSSTSTAIKAYQQASRIVIMEQGFWFKKPVDGLADGNGGVIVESAVYAYSGRIDTNYVNHHAALNDADASPALTVCTRYSSDRLNFASIYRG
uniref:Uncharacterized protein n=1 Tax=viral metagenome TaxID=1070528 RepID=A0A6M3IZH2_9ZZZZ